MFLKNDNFYFLFCSKITCPGVRPAPWTLGVDTTGLGGLDALALSSWGRLRCWGLWEVEAPRIPAQRDVACVPLSHCLVSRQWGSVYRPGGEL